MLKNILVVDDEQVNLDLMAGLLGSKYELKLAMSGAECITIMESWSPDVILMDVNMPGMNGLDTCKKVRHQASSDSLSIIFLSGDAQPEERLAGYAAGGDDYISKPFNYEELQKKVKLALDNKTKLDGFRQSSDDAMNMAMTAMSQASDVGNILRFYQSSIHIESMDVLTKLLSDTLISFGVNSVLYFNLSEEEIYYSSTGVVKPLERTAIEHLKNNDRIYSFSKCTLFNYGIVSVLVTDMPIGDEKKYGELKDIIATLVEAAELRVAALVIQIERDLTHQENIKLIKATQFSLKQLDEQQLMSIKEHEVLISELIDDVQQSFIRLGLPENQQNELMARINTVEDESNEILKKNSVVREKIDTVIKSLNR